MIASRLLLMMMMATSTSVLSTPEEMVKVTVRFFASTVLVAILLLLLLLVDVVIVTDGRHCCCHSRCRIRFRQRVEGRHTSTVEAEETGRWTDVMMETHWMSSHITASSSSSSAAVAGCYSCNPRRCGHISAHR